MLGEKIEAGTTHETMVTAMTRCQYELHKCRSTNQVSFDENKEGMFVLHRKCSLGDDFNLLGIWLSKLLRSLQRRVAGS